MTDTVRTLPKILALLPDNSNGDISPQDLRDQTVTVFRDIIYDTVALLLASTEASRGTGAIWEAGGFRYIEVASGGDITNSAGTPVQLDVLAGGFDLTSFTFVPPSTANYTIAVGNRGNNGVGVTNAFDNISGREDLKP